MIKTLRITTVVAAILAVIFFVFPVVFGVRSDERIEEFLNLPGVIDKFNKTVGNKAKRSESRSSPLVQQAAAFALYLNPPTPQIPKGILTRDKTGITPPALPVTPRFKVIGISYYEERPERSLALIDEPGKGRHWVRQSSTVGHLVIEQVRESLVVVKGSKGTFELPVEQRPQVSLLEGASPVSGRAGGQSSSKSVLAPSGRTGAGLTRARGLPQPRRSAEEKARLEDLAARLKEIQKGYKSDKTDSGPSAEERAALVELISNFKSSRISAEEAKRLDDLGKELKDVRDDPNQSLPAK